MKRKGSYTHFLQALRECSRSDIVEYIEQKRANDKEQKETSVAKFAAIKQSLQELYLERFRNIIPISALPFDFDIENQWVPLTLKLDGASVSTEHHADLFNKAFTKKVKMLVIEGDPASGKTSLLRRLAYEWTGGESQLGHYDLVLYAEFREVREKEFDTIIELVNHYMRGHLDKDDHKRFEHFITNGICCKQHQILVLLDGYDESSLKQQCQELSDYLFSNIPKKLLRVNVVLTSRKGYLSDLRGKGRFAFFDVLGFTSDLQKENYISKYSDNLPLKDITSVQDLLRTNKTLARLSETPLMLAFICLLHGRRTVRTETELFMSIIWWLIDRHQHDNPSRDVPDLFGFEYDGIDKFEVIERFYCHFPELHKLGKMAMSDIFKSTFTKNDLDQFQLNSIVEQVGLLRKATKMDDNYHKITEFSFIHRTLQEFFMALSFFFSSEEPTELFCDYIFGYQGAIGAGIIQEKIHAYLDMIKSSKAEISIVRKDFFIALVNDWNYINPFLDLNSAQNFAMENLQSISHSQSKNELKTYLPPKIEDDAFKTQFGDRGRALPRQYLQDTNENSENPPQSAADAIQQLRQAAEQGNAGAQCNEGVMYELGRGVPQSDQEAVKWFRKAAEEGHACGQFNLALMYQNGRGVPQSDEEAVKWYRKAAEQGLAPGQFNLALMYQNGQGVAQSDEEAVKWYRKAAEQGFASGHFNLGLVYQNGQGVPQLDEAGVKWYRKAAEQGFASGQFNLALMYDKGQGVPQSDEEAVKWYRKAAEQGHADSQNNLGERYYYGQGVPQSNEEAIIWYRKAIEQANAHAHSNLGRMYMYGRGVPQSYEEAIKLFSSAIEQGNIQGQNNLGFMYQYGRGVTQSDEEALKWYRKAAEGRNGDGQINLGFMYQNGRGVTQSDEEAVKWYKKAVEQRSADGENNLGLIFKNGRDVLHADNEALKLHNTAAELGGVFGQF